MKRAGRRAAKKEDEPARAKYAAGRGGVPDATPADHVIVHLNVDDPTTDQTHPPRVDAYNAGDMGDYSYVESADPPSQPVACYASLLEEFSKKTDSGDWPAATGVHCYWCCHAFSWSPVSLPFDMSHVDEATVSTCKVNGCFCSFQCAAAYNFDTNGDVDDMWNKYAMLNRLHWQYVTNRGGTGDIPRVIPAPPRYTLQMFGGTLSIDEFRGKTVPQEVVQRNGETSVNTGTFVDVLQIPMTFVSQQVEEINEADVAKPLKFIPVDQDRINKVREKLQLKRSKPLIDSKHTLDHIMNLRISATTE